MISFKVFNQRNGRLATLAALSVATLGQAFMPALVSADQVSDRSVSLSSAVKDATDVTYNVTFTPVTSAAAFVVEFCSNSPLIGEACTAPADMDASGAGTSTAGAAISTTTAATANKVAVTATLTNAVATTVAIDHIDNPSAAGTVYARIVTYDTDAHTANYASTDVGAGAVDQGSVALSITDNMSVSGAVLESLEFCISAVTLDSNCANATTPTLSIGETTGTVKALTTEAVSTGTVYTLLSTNAVGGAVVSLKSSAANCGGLILAGKTGATGCNITPLTAAAADFKGTAKFGVKLGADITDAGSGALTHEGTYNDTTYYMGYDSSATPATGVTSVYGDPVFSSAGYANKLPMSLTFGASVAPNTPAGRYSADLGLIATGTF